jgi:hypothetical protein
MTTEYHVINMQFSLRFYVPAGEKLPLFIVAVTCYTSKHGGSYKNEDGVQFTEERKKVTIYIQMHFGKFHINKCYPANLLN